MSDDQSLRLAGRQFNRIARYQLLDLGLTPKAIDYRLRVGRLVIVEQGVFAIPPVLEHDELGRWMGATLTHRGSLLSRVSAAAAYGAWSVRRDVETITRPGNGGPVRHGGVLAFRSGTLDGEGSTFRGIPITTPERTALDIGASLSSRATARVVRELVRLRLTSLDRLADCSGRHRGERGCGALGRAIAAYAGLPLEHAKSGAEVRALEIVRDAGLPLPALNVRIAGEEADLSWPEARVIVEIDGREFHLDVGEDARRTARWVAAGWRVSRIDANVIYADPSAFLLLLRELNVARAPR